MKSVRTKIVAFVVIPLVLVLGIYSILLYINLRQIIVDNQEGYLSGLAVSACKDMSLWLDGKKREMSTVADAISRAGNKRSSINTRLKTHAMSNPEYEMVFYADTKGNAFTSSDFRASIVDRAYFRQALAAGKTVVSDPVVSRQSMHPIVAIATPVRKGELVTGVVGCTISLDYLSRLISHIKPAKTGYAFVIQGDGTTIIHPDRELVLKHNVLRDPQMGPDIKDVVSKMVNRQTGLAKYDYNNVAKYLAFAPVPGTNWSLAINAPVNEVLGQLSSINRLIVGAPLFVAILASALVSLLLIYFVVRPITNLRNMMLRVENGDLDVRIDYSSRDEIGQLTDSFNRMAQTIRHGKEKIEQSEAKYRSIFENSAIGIFQTTPGGRFISSNPFLAELFGFDSAQELVTHFNDIGKEHYVDPNDREYFKRILETEGIIRGFETRLLKKDGTPIWASLTARAVKDDAGSALYYEGTLEDITSRRRAEEALKQSESRMSNIIEFLPDATFAIDSSGCIITWNKAIEEMTGFTAEDMLGKGNYEYAIPFYGERRPILVDFLSSWDEDMAKSYSFINKDGNTLYTETGAPFVRGKRRVLWAKAAPLFDEEGNITGAIESIRDITNQKMAEEALRDSEELFRNVFDNHAAVKLLIDPDTGNITGANKAAAEYYGWPKEELCRMNIRDINTLSQNAVEKEMEKAKTLQRTYFEFRHRRADGTVRDVAVFSSNITTKGKAVLHSIVHDITDRKRVEEELNRQSEAMAASVDGMAILDNNQEYIYLNDAHASIYGYESPGELLGKSWRILYNDDELKRFEKEIMPRFSEEGRWRGESVGRKKDGSKFYQDVSLTALKDVGLICVVRDITERKRLESQLRQSQKMESIGTLAGGIAHDFNNILTSLMGSASIMQVKMDKDNPLRRYVDQILSASQKAADLAKSLLTFSRQQSVTLAPLDINNTINTTQKLLKRLLTEDIELRTSLTEHKTVVMADKSQMDQILFNLATNARDAMPKGGTLAVETDVVVIDTNFIKAHGFGETGRYVLISISDTGIGMDKTTLEKIFDPFFTTKEPGKGTGLGLPTVYGIVKQHNGYITVYSEQGMGTTFRIYLPGTETKTREEQDTTLPVPKGSETILIAEDNEDARHFMQDALQEYGYKTIEAVDGEDAIDKFRQNKDIDLIIVDSVMPKKNGREVFEKTHEMNPRIKVLFISGYTRDVVLDKGIEDGELDFIAKPLSLNEFLRKVREVLDRNPAVSCK